MKKVSIIYNPFLLTTVITIDGKKQARTARLTSTGRECKNGQRICLSTC